MRLCFFIVLFVFSYAECRKSVPIDKNANAAFINMEGGGYRPPPSTVKPLAVPVKPPPPNNAKPAVPGPAPVNPPSKPGTLEPMKPSEPPKPTQAPSHYPVHPPVSTTLTPKTPNQIKPVPVYPTPAVNPITTPGPGSVKQLITFYDSQGKASPIRPYTYSQAVKQG